MNVEQIKIVLEDLGKQYQSASTKLIKLEGAIEIMQQLLKITEEGGTIGEEKQPEVEEGVYEEA